MVFQGVGMEGRGWGVLYRSYFQLCLNDEDEDDQAQGRQTGSDPQGLDEEHGSDPPRPIPACDHIDEGNDDGD
eukprot:4862817-Karenia_brevis.AAC.1